MSNRNRGNANFNTVMSTQYNVWIEEEGQDGKKTYVRIGEFYSRSAAKTFQDGVLTFGICRACQEGPECLVRKIGTFKCTRFRPMDG